MILNFSDEQTTQVQTDVFAQASYATPQGNDDGHSVIRSSGEVAGIELRMLPPFVRNNHTVSMWPFPGRARLYCLTLVVSDASNQLSGLMELNAFPRIGDGEFLSINKTIYYWQEEGAATKPPGQVHVMCSIIKSKEALRETAEILASVKDDEGYKSIIGELSSVLSNAASLTAVTSLTMQAAHIVGRYLGKVDDQPIGTVVNSFTSLHGDWDRLGISPIKVGTRDVDFNFELIIRDRNRQQMAQSGTLILPPAYRPSPEGIAAMVPM